MTLYAFDGKQPQLPDDGSAWVAPSADLIGDVRLGSGASIWFNAVIRADNTPIIVGARTNVQEGAVIHSDPGQPCTIGEGCTIGHKAMLHGCTLGNNVLIGINAVVLNGAVIPDECLVGAGALVTEGKTFPPGSMILGSPARAVRQLDDNALAMLRRGGDGYAAVSQRFAKELRVVG